MFSSCRHRQTVRVHGDEWVLTSTEELPPACQLQQQQQQQQQQYVMHEQQATTSAVCQYHPWSHCEMQTESNGYFDLLRHHHGPYHHQQQQLAQHQFYNHVASQSSEGAIDNIVCRYHTNENFYQHNINGLTAQVRKSSVKKTQILEKNRIFYYL